MPKVTYHKEGELPEEPERDPKTMLEIDKPSTDEITVVATGHALATETLDGVGAEAARAAEMLEETQEVEIDTMNEFGLGLQMKTIRPIAFPQFTTKQQAFRFAAWLVFMAETLPDEVKGHTFLEIAEAIKNT